MTKVSPDGVAHSGVVARPADPLRARAGETELIGAGGCDDGVELGVHFPFQSFADNVDLRMD
jgi:hypothetical protein